MKISTIYAIKYQVCCMENTVQWLQNTVCRKSQFVSTLRLTHHHFNLLASVLKCTYYGSGQLICALVKVLLHVNYLKYK